MAIQVGAGRSALFGAGGGSLRDLLHLHHRPRDLLHASSLFLTAHIDFIDQRFHRPAFPLSPISPSWPALCPPSDPAVRCHRAMSKSSPGSAPPYRAPPVH